MSKEIWQEILNVGCDGGCISLLGQKINDHWKFKMKTDESTMRAFFDEEDLPGELKSESYIVSTWEEALKLLGQYPHWPGLYPIFVHPDFAKEIVNALHEWSESPEQGGQINWDNWKRVLHVKAEPEPEPVTNRPHQRLGAHSNTQVGNDFERIARRYFERIGMKVEPNVTIEIGIHGRIKKHKFDLVDRAGLVLIECKSHKWTAGGNIPSAKITTWDQAMYHFHSTPAGYRKIFFVLNDVCPRRGISLGQYYVNNNAHLIPNDVEIWEFDVDKEEATRIDPV